LFLNPDTVVVGDALRTMVAYMDAHPGVGVLGPMLRYGDGRLQSSRRRFPTLAAALCESTPVEWHWPGNPWARAYRLEDEPSQVVTSEPATPVDWVVGAAMLMRRAALEQVGGFDEGYFMYSEEPDWCLRAARAGWRTVYLPAAQVIHYEGQSSDQIGALRQIRFQRSRVRYFKKFHGPLTGEVLRVALLGMFAGEWLLEAGKWVLGSRRTLRRKRMRAYGQLLRSRLR
jgi:GT2 family glycosyltransferase